MAYQDPKGVESISGKVSGEGGPLRQLCNEPHMSRGPSHPQDKEAPSAREMHVIGLGARRISVVPSSRAQPLWLPGSSHTPLELGRSEDVAEGGESKGGKPRDGQDRILRPHFSTCKSDLPAQHSHSTVQMKTEIGKKGVEGLWP